MSDKENTNKFANEEQLAYAALLGRAAVVGLVILLITFVLYISGALSPSIPLDEIGDYWSLPLNEYLEKTGYEAGWSWTKMLDKGDYLNYIGISLLGVISIFCYLRVMPIFIRKKKFAFLIIAIVQIGVLLLAASGYLTR